MLSGIVPVRLLPLTSLETLHEAFSFRMNKNIKSKEDNAKETQHKIMNTHKYHRPVNWHISGDSVPVNELPRNPLLKQFQPND